MPQFMILADDYKDENALQRRLAVRQEHLQRMLIEKDAGRFIIGGAKLNAKQKMLGSMLIVELEDKEAVEEWLSVDPYVTGKVWEHIEIIPFKVADV